MKLSAQWDDDGEYWFFNTTDQHDPAYGTFLIDVPDDMAAVYLEAVATCSRLADEIPKLCGLAPDEGKLIAPCDCFNSVSVSSKGMKDFRRCDTCGHYTYHHADQGAA